jgi:hypothetical protein
MMRMAYQQRAALEGLQVVGAHHRKHGWKLRSSIVLVTPCQDGAKDLHAYPGAQLSLRWQSDNATLSDRTSWIVDHTEPGDTPASLKRP